MTSKKTNLIRVLLVDDDQEDYYLTKLLFDDFKDTRYKLDWTSDSQQALESMKLSEYDIYFVDYRLDPVNGLDILREAIVSGCKSPIILLTGQGDKAVDFQAMQAGAADYLVKGEIEAPLLERVIRYSLQHARSVEKIQASETKFRSVIQSASDAIFLVNQDGLITLWNKAAERIFGYSETEIIGKSAKSLLKENYDRKSFGCKADHKIDQVLTSMSGKVIESVGQRRDKSEFPLEIAGSIWETSEGVFYTAIIRDITERKRTEAVLQHNALYDTLTNLPNRTQFMNYLQKAIKVYEENSISKFAVLFLDLDRFKVINDGLGHLIGDKLLVAISQRIKSILRPGDVVSRLGGDEFTLLIHNVNQVEDAISVAERIQFQLSNPFKIENYKVFSSASIGILISDFTKRTPQEYLRDADSAMYCAKETGKSRYKIFDDKMYIRNMQILQIETDLRKAIERNEFRVYYQPIVCLESGKIKELEAVIRWYHPEQGLIQPDNFIKIAEETGMIIPIGEWVLEEACQQTKVWQNLIPNLKNLKISVNLSAKQIVSPLIVSKVKNILSHTGLDSNCLKLEVTEGTVMENSEIALEVMNELSSMGVSFSIDDFGTGYSSLSYVHQFPFKRIKIDRSFIGKMDADLKCEAIVRTILTLGQTLGIEMVAEGIETQSQLRKLKALRCQYGQGYLFSRPVNPSSIDYLFKQEFQPDFFAENGLSGENSNPLNLIELTQFQ